jgi:hypothetical protein
MTLSDDTHSDDTHSDDTHSDDSLEIKYTQMYSLLIQRQNFLPSIPNNISETPKKSKKLIQ